MTVVERARALPWRDVERPALGMVWLAGVFIAGQALVLYVRMDWVGRDSHAYWATAHRPELYSVPPGGLDAFNYSPAFAQVVWPLAQLPWPAFCLLWMALEVAAFAWLLWPLGARWAIPLVLLCASEWTIGNVVPFLAIAAVLGLRKWPGWWAIVALVKPTMALGPVWFAARGEWRKVAVSAAATLAVVLASYALWRSAWPAWFDFLGDSANDQGDRNVIPRAVVAVVVTFVAGRLNARWLLVVAMLIATPVWAGAASLTIVAMLPRLGYSFASGGQRAAHYGA